MDTLPSYYIIEVLDEATELPEEPAELVNTDQIVRQALHTARTDLNEVGLELRPSDIAEKRLVDNFLSSGCQCTKAHGGCSSHFSAKYVTETRASFAEMSRQDLDMVLLGQLLAFTSISAYTYTSHHLPAGERSKCYTHFFHQGQPICSKMFHFLHGVGTTDFCFGLFKRLFKRTKVDCMADIAKVVEDSAACNSAQLVYTEDGTSIVPMRDWVSYLAPHFKRVANIKKFHHFHMSAVSPGVITLKTHADSKEQSLSVLRDGWTPSHLELPPRLVPKGLTEERQWYLFDQIRQFCSTNKDVTCPRPLTPRPK